MCSDSVTRDCRGGAGEASAAERLRLYSVESAWYLSGGLVLLVMRRTRLRAALLIVVGAALAGIGYLVTHNVSLRHARTLDDLGADFLPQVAQRIQNFHRVKMQNGRAVWEITASDAQYFEAENAVVVIEPKMTLFLKEEGREAHITGAEGRLHLEGHDVTGLTLRGGVAVRLDDMELHTDEATYDRSRDLITSPGIVTIRGRTLDVQGRGMEFEVGPQHVRLLADVHTTVHRDAAPS